MSPFQYHESMSIPWVHNNEKFSFQTYKNTNNKNKELKKLNLEIYRNTKYQIEETQLVEV